MEKSNAAIRALSKEEQAGVAGQMDDLFRSLSHLRGENPASAAVQKAMEQMFRYFNEQFGGIYTPEIFAGLGQMYVEDARFTKNIDRYGDGLAQFLARAMSIYAERQAK